MRAMTFIILLNISREEHLKKDEINIRNLGTQIFPLHEPNEPTNPLGNKDIKCTAFNFPNLQLIKYDFPLWSQTRKILSLHSEY